ncbi:DUF3530 family protein [Shewanella acanthi]|uniref:DUF3530 family protein n=1 Tax=Shewanella acanthi TaxID=2864212 RepID=UPI001C65E168|nr:DUF3530 family protein [Shewanella acanthi]QYJ79275.1 alpha/beta hydrolase family protein [Shewanella acanthi]
MARLASIIFTLLICLSAFNAIAAEPEPATPATAVTEASSKPASEKSDATKANEPIPAKPKANFGYLPTKEVQQIKVDNQQLDLLVRPWEGKKKLGAAIILPATNGSADSPGVMAYIRRNINPAGWASLSITPPIDPPSPNFATDAKEVASAGEGQLTNPSNKPSQKRKPEESDKQLQSQESLLVKSMEKLAAVSDEYPGKRVLVTAEQSAALIIKLLSDNKITPPDVLVVINPYSLDDKRNQELPEKLAKLQLPILDIQSPDGHPASLETAELRKTLALSLEAPNYRQNQLALNLDNESAWQNCLQLIRGFAAHGSGK